MKRKLVSSLVIICLLMSCVPFSAFASELNSKEIYVSKELGVTFERLIKDDRIIVNIKSPEGSLIHELMDYAGNTYLDGEIISSNNLSSSVDLEVLKTYTEADTKSSISWGQWQTTTVATIQTGGHSAAVIYGLMALYAGWCPLGVILTIATITAGMYEELKIKVSIRYGSDDEYYYYERYTYFYGDGVLISNPVNPFFDTGKEPLV